MIPPTTQPSNIIPEIDLHRRREAKTIAKLAASTIAGGGLEPQPVVPSPTVASIGRRP
jgi:hypothetical protein